MQNISYSFFLGANSAAGFSSLYDYLIDLETANDVFVIKGGPGSGKSSFMKRAASALIELGAVTEYIPCSSDPDSLDGIVFPELKVAFVDGTSPHVVEPKFPYITDRYLHTGIHCDPEKLTGVKKEIKRAFAAYRGCYPNAYRCTNAAKLIGDEMFGTVISSGAIEKTLRRTKGVIKREIPKLAAAASEKKRFLSAISPKGLVFLNDTVNTLCRKVYELADTYGLSHFMLCRIKDAALEAGHTIYSCYSPLNPEKLEHILIPALSLGFVTSNNITKYEGTPYRRIRLDAYLDPDVLIRNKQRLKFMKKTKLALLDEAVNDLKEAKLSHDSLEKLYNPAIDFDGLYASADEMSKSLLKKYGQTLTVDS
ncbi:MAG: hypothetical protein LBL09_00710 [Oscillospiraceae bacterium]|jgi:hypothetical protein|nr:hypothetical protein [Oscillospiraceae bacterium]